MPPQSAPCRCTRCGVVLFVVIEGRPFGRASWRAQDVEGHDLLHPGEAPLCYGCILVVLRDRGERPNET